jgi:hypothetical protein
MSTGEEDASIKLPTVVTIPSNLSETITVVMCASSREPTEDAGRDVLFDNSRKTIMSDYILKLFGSPCAF